MVSIYSLSIGILILFSNAIESSNAFVPVKHTKPQATFISARKSLLNEHARLRAVPSQLTGSLFDDFDDFEASSLSSASGSSSNQDAADIYASLRDRQDSLSSSPFQYSTQSGDSSDTIFQYNDEHEFASNWRDAECVSSVRLQLDDWIRRIAVDTYPLAVCGSAKGNIYLSMVPSAGSEIIIWGLAVCLVNGLAARGGGRLAAFG